MRPLCDRSPSPPRDQYCPSFITSIQNIRRSPVVTNTYYGHFVSMRLTLGSHFGPSGEVYDGPTQNIAAGSQDYAHRRFHSS
ncbi:hypothetical protein GDO78_022703 [Eleutherodactylus coqui]|uniref:Uncharacterized protein n=1 Tax=Eleutherodactylus coqui TaxID=57060 RepID=A0A8J6EG46_ELECQ|nr:hypothetical protein GDO78_022703 [Eleutherodactylus coqui]